MSKFHAFIDPSRIRPDMRRRRQRVRALPADRVAPRRRDLG
jgi:hypothetical protein